MLPDLSPEIHGFLKKSLNVEYQVLALAGDARVRESTFALLLEINLGS